MRIFAWTLILEALLSLPLTLLGLTYKDNYLFCLIIISINSFALLISLLTTYNKRGQWAFFIMIYVSYLIRMSLVYVDVFIVPLTIDDVYDYQDSAATFFYTSEPLFRGGFRFYAIFAGFIYKIFGDNRILLQHFGVLMGVGGAWYIYKSLELLSIDEKYKKTGLLFAIFSPNLFREIIVTDNEPWIYFFVAVSLYWFIKWYKEKSILFFMVASTFCVIASLFHSGVIALGLGYALIFVFYDLKGNRYTFNVKTIFLISLIALSFMVIYASEIGSVLFFKFRALTSIESIASRNVATGGSGYTVGGSLTGIKGFLLYTPLRMIYFIGSPMPWDWRGLLDMVAFLGSGFVRIIIILMFAVEYFKNKNFLFDKNFMRAMLIVTMCSLLPFAWGVSNAATAIRHRDKYIAIFAVMLAITLSNRKDRILRMKSRRMKSKK